MTAKTRQHPDQRQDARSGQPAPIDPALLRALGAPAMYPGRQAVSVRETHASWVFLAGEHAYKIKKPVALGFLDFATLERRLQACREEVRCNQELAPGIYLGVLAIVPAEGGFRFAAHDTPGAVEYAVLMRRFDEGDTMSGLIAAGKLRPEHLERAAARLARFHGSAVPVAGRPSPAQMLQTWLENVRQLELLDPPQRWHLETMAGFGRALVSARSGELERRAGEGRFRDGHGDLRCEHVLFGEAVQVVDRIEFDPAVRQMDVARDLAFLVMDLQDHRRGGAARNLVSAYRHAGGQPGSETLRCFYGAYWALVRAKVALIRDRQARPGQVQARAPAAAERLWELAESLCWRARRPVAILVCGAPASGKSTLAARLSERSGLPVVSSDQARKRLAGLGASERAAPEHYSRAFTHATYDLLSREALERLGREGGVIVDATCSTRSRRALLLHRLALRSVTRLVVHCQVSEQTALARARSRMGFAGRISDATPRIVAEQLHGFQPLEELDPATVLRLDSEQPLDVQLAAVAQAVDERLAAHRGPRERRERARGLRALPQRSRDVYPDDGGGAGG